MSTSVCFFFISFSLALRAIPQRQRATTYDPCLAPTGEAIISIQHANHMHMEIGAGPCITSTSTSLYMAALAMNQSRRPSVYRAPCACGRRAFWSIVELGHIRASSHPLFFASPVLNLLAWEHVRNVSETRTDGHQTTPHRPSDLTRDAGADGRSTETT
jgi:hypothetical protein